MKNNLHLNSCLTQHFTLAKFKLSKYNVSVCASFFCLLILCVVCFLYQVMRIVDNVRPDRQTVMFSATFPRAMEALARRILAKPIEVQVGGRSVVCSDVEQHVVSHPS